jgi:hypothetical protein
MASEAIPDIVVLSKPKSAKRGLKKMPNDCFAPILTIIMIKEAIAMI